MFSAFELIIFIGITQGIVTSLLLFNAKKSKLSKKLLGTALLLLCIVNFRIVFHNLAWSQIAPLRYLPLGWELFIPPLFYLYVLSLTKKSFAMKKAFYWQFLPGAIFLFYDLTIYALTATKATLASKDQLVSSLYFHPMNQIEDYLIVISSISYSLICYKILAKFRLQIQSLNANRGVNVYRWLRALLLLMGLVALFLAVNELLDEWLLDQPNSLLHWRIFNLFLAFSIYYLGLRGYRLEQSSLHTDKRHIESVSKKLNDEKVQLVEQQLIELLEKQKVFLDPTLTLSQLAQMADSSTETLSFVINQKFNKSYRDLINYYRVTTVKQKLRQNSSDKESVLNLALESGFNSQASFYRAFKKFSGMTPKQFLTKIS